MKPDSKAAPQPQPEPLPPAEHEKALAQEEKQQRNRRGAPDVTQGELPQTHSDAD